MSDQAKMGLTWASPMQQAHNAATKPCPDCERYKESAKNWRHKAYELSGHPLPWEPESKLVLWNFKQNRLAGPADPHAEVALIREREWQGLTDEEIRYASKGETFFDFARAIEAKLKEKNT